MKKLKKRRLVVGKLSTMKNDDLSTFFICVEYLVLRGMATIIYSWAKELAARPEEPAEALAKAGRLEGYERAKNNLT